MKRFTIVATLLALAGFVLYFAWPRVTQRLASRRINQLIRYENCLSRVQPPPAGTDIERVATEISQRMEAYYRDAETMRAREVLQLGNGLSTTIDFDWRPDAYSAVAWSGGRKVLTIHFAGGHAREHNHLSGATYAYRCVEPDGPEHIISTQGMEGFDGHLGGMLGTRVGKHSEWAGRYAKIARGSKYIGTAELSGEVVDVLEYVIWISKPGYTGGLGANEFPGLEQVDSAWIYLYYVTRPGRLAACHLWRHENGNTRLEYTDSFCELSRSPPASRPDAPGKAEMSQDDSPVMSAPAR